MKYKRIIIIMLIVAAIVFVNERVIKKESPATQNPTPTRQVDEQEPSPIVVAGVDQEQITRVYLAGDKSYALFQKDNKLFPTDSESASSGVLVNENDDWRLLVEIKDLTTDVNNPFHMWPDEDFIYLLVVDDSPKSENEGIAKLVKADLNSREWSTEDCFYFYKDSFSKTLGEGLTLDETLAKYYDNNDIEAYVYDKDLKIFQDNGVTVSECQNFEL